MKTVSTLSISLIVMAFVTMLGACSGKSNGNGNAVPNGAYIAQGTPGITQGGTWEGAMNIVDFNAYKTFLAESRLCYNEYSCAQLGGWSFLRLQINAGYLPNRGSFIVQTYSNNAYCGPTLASSGAASFNVGNVGYQLRYQNYSMNYGYGYGYGYAAPPPTDSTLQIVTSAPYADQSVDVTVRYKGALLLSGRAYTAGSTSRDGCASRYVQQMRPF